MKKLFLFVIFFSMAAMISVLFCSCGSFSPVNPIPAVKNFDIARYMGKWYEIARLPHSFERNVTDAQAVYTLQDDGTVIVENSGLINDQTTYAHAVARMASNDHSGILEVSFFYPFYSMYKVIYLNKDYTLAIVTGNSMEYLWILARRPIISKAELEMCLKKLDQWGYAVKLLQYPTGEIKTILSAQDN